MVLLLTHGDFLYIKAQKRQKCRLFLCYNYGSERVVIMFNPYFQNLQNYGTQAQNYIPYNTPYNAPQGGNNQLIRVTGLDGAKAYQMAANSTVALFDSNDDIMYVKTTDGAGFGTIRAFSFSEIDLSATAKPTSTEYVTKEEFEKLRNEVQTYAEQFISKPKTAKSKSIADDSAV